MAGGAEPKCYVGIDLAGSPRRPTGYAVSCSGRVVYGIVYGDDEVLALLPGPGSIVAIDSPLRVPRGLRGYREVDKLLIRLGYRVLPPSWRGMRVLVERAERLREVLEARGAIVIETHPRSALLSSGCSSVEELAHRLGFSIDASGASRDEADAIIALMVAYCYDRGCALRVAASDGVIYLLSRVCNS